MKKIVIAGVLLTAMSGTLAHAQSLGGGLSDAAHAMSDFGHQAALLEMEKEMQDQQLQDEHQRRLQELEYQHNLQIKDAKQMENVAIQRQKSAYVAAMDHLQTRYPNWRYIVAPGDEKPFRIWLAKQPSSYRTSINATNDPAQVEAAISDFFDSLGETNVIGKAQAKRN